MRSEALEVTELTLKQAQASGPARVSDRDNRMTKNPQQIPPQSREGVSSGLLNERDRSGNKCAPQADAPEQEKPWMVAVFEREAAEGE
ncbi:hypothetical protein KEM54_006019 [Ascosphaera aggregata]|nr:hypothetical protein KEM54_006019 [Ascosphaera aggregata]